MGKITVSLSVEKEKLLRDLARDLYGGKKGAVSKVVSDGINELARKDKRLRAIRNQVKIMSKGFDLGLKDNEKIYEKRSDIYDD